LSARRRERVFVKSPIGYAFSCTRCATCCSTGPNVSLTSYDVARLSKKLGLSCEGFLKLYAKLFVADVVPVAALRGDERGRCVFLGYEGGVAYCKVYDARPARCRAYPLIPRSPSSSVAELDEKCPGWRSDPSSSLSELAEEYERYAAESYKHYKKVLELVLEGGLDPVEAFLRACDEAARELEERAGRS